jgi:hypothetical protein
MYRAGRDEADHPVGQAVVVTERMTGRWGLPDLPLCQCRAAAAPSLVGRESRPTRRPDRSGYSRARPAGQSHTGNRTSMLRSSPPSVSGDQVDQLSASQTEYRQASPARETIAWRAVPPILIADSGRGSRVRIVRTRSTGTLRSAPCDRTQRGVRAGVPSGAARESTR